MGPPTGRSMIRSRYAAVFDGLRVSRIPLTEVNTPRAITANHIQMLWSLRNIHMYTMLEKNHRFFLGRPRFLGISDRVATRPRPGESGDAAGFMRIDKFIIFTGGHLYP